MSDTQDTPIRNELSKDYLLTPERKVELEQVLGRMQVTANGIYSHMFNQGFGDSCHAFLEHCGLLGEFINVCRNALAAGHDFTHANVHSGRPLPLQPFQVTYLREKLECIYGEGICEKLAERR